ncbi:hypothetical protein [Flavisphingomonas formosensis]|uniref:hypothetical protein n=1 Tax=Flavisphingomonas formosensis TaxID=861534 RepID=UPI0012F97BC1|nr:hypothetical protein [Sphingomonas formosensis]
MVFALNRSMLIVAGVTLVVGLICAIVLVDGGASSGEIWARRGSVILAVNLVIGALCIPRVFALAHGISFARYWWFPLLDGEWDAEIHSNWPRIRKMHEAALSKASRFDALRDTLSAEEEAESVIRASVVIRSSLILFSLRLEPHGSARISRSQFVRPRWSKPDLPELAYVYEQIDPGRVAATDSRRHFGAGIIRYDSDNDTLCGEYWTQRREDLGFNTAGTILLTRKEKTA